MSFVDGTKGGKESQGQRQPDPGGPLAADIIAEAAEHDSRREWGGVND